MDPKLEFRNVNLIKDRTRIISKADLRIPEGSIVAIVGPSGSGKTSLLRLMNRLEEPSSGNILLDGSSIFKMDPMELRRKVGMVFQLPALFDGTVAENIAYGPRLKKEEDVKAKVRDALRAVGLKQSFLKRSVKKLSVGEAQRVTIARACANDPEALLMDEPTSALDTKATGEIEDLIGKLNNGLGLTFVVVTHDHRQARRIGTHVLPIKKGRVGKLQGTKAFFKENPLPREKDHICCKE